LTSSDECGDLSTGLLQPARRTGLLEKLLSKSPQKSFILQN
jgi:hypothetical protein